MPRAGANVCQLSAKKTLYLVGHTVGGLLRFVSGRLNGKKTPNSGGRDLLKFETLTGTEPRVEPATRSFTSNATF